jgi:hypothetical protein
MTREDIEMKPLPRTKVYPASENRFFMSILAVLIVSTVLTGGTAISLATGMFGDRNIEIAAVAPLYSE